MAMFQVTSRPDSLIPAALLSLLAIYVTSKTLTYFRGLRVVNFQPGPRPIFHPLWLPGAIIPSTWWNPGLRMLWNGRFSLYKRYQSEVISLVPLVAGIPTLYTSNLEVAKQVTAGGHKSNFIKPEQASQALLLWGMNLVSADGDMWRKHRRVMGPAFSHKLYEYVWKESIRTFRDMSFNEEWADRKTVDVPVVQRLTFKFALFIIGKCAFGFPFKWSEPPTAQDGSMSLQEALRIVTDTFLIMTALPDWAFKLPITTLRKAKEAQLQLRGFMQEQVEKKKRDVNNSTDEDMEDDAFTRLVQASEDESSKYRLDDDELIGNVFVMLFAGHETTAHTLAATLGFLAYHQNIQEDVYEQILSVVGKTREPALDDYNKLEKVLAVFFEALRLFPAGHLLIRMATEDTVLTIPNPIGQEGTRTIPVPKGTQIVVDMVGIQYNPRYFDEPEKFKPSRWNGVQADSEAFSAFNIGPRACLGRKFALTESVAFLTMLLRDWKVEPLLKAEETKEQWKDRVLDAKVGLTLGVSDMPIKLVRRG